MAIVIEEVGYLDEAKTVPIRGKRKRERPSRVKGQLVNGEGRLGKVNRGYKCSKTMLAQYSVIWRHRIDCIL